MSARSNCIPGRVGVSPAGDGVLAIANFRNLGKDRFGETPKPAGETPTLPGAIVIASGVLLLSFCLASCRRGMIDQQHLKPLAEENFFSDGRAARNPPAHTVARGELRDDEQLYTGKIGEQLAATFPQRVTRQTLTRGRERFEIYCAVCHGPTGKGNGMIVQRGFPQPPSFHEERLRAAPVGHFFDVITNGYGVMYSYASRVAPEDRWAIVAYIRALQLSQHATAADADPQQLKELQP